MDDEDLDSTRRIRTGRDDASSSEAESRGTRANAACDSVSHARCADAPLSPIGGPHHETCDAHPSTAPPAEESGLGEPDAGLLGGLIFRRLGSWPRLSSLACGTSNALIELAEARSRADRHYSSFADLPRADLIQSPPTALLLELAPTPRARRPHPTVGAYAFSIALSEPDLRAHLFSSKPPYDITETPCFCDDFDGMEGATCM